MFKPEWGGKEKIGRKITSPLMSTGGRERGAWELSEDGPTRSVGVKNLACVMGSRGD